MPPGPLSRLSSRAAGHGASQQAQPQTRTPETKRSLPRLVPNPVPSWREALSGVISSAYHERPRFTAETPTCLIPGYGSASQGTVGRGPYVRPTSSLKPEPSESGSAPGPRAESDPTRCGRRRPLVRTRFLHVAFLSLGPPDDQSPHTQPLSSGSSKASGRRGCRQRSRTP